MRRKYDLVLTAVLTFCIAGVFLPSHNADAQMTDTCADGKVLVIDATNKRYKCSAAAGIPLVYRATGVNLNAGANTDSGSTFTNLPAKYLILHLFFDNASGTPTLSTMALRTASGGGGTAIVTAQALTTLSAANITVDSVLAVTTTQTAATLYLRNVAAAGGVMTADATLEVLPLP